MRIGGRSLEQTNRRNYIFMCVHVSNRRVCLSLSLYVRVEFLHRAPVLKYRCVFDFTFVEECASVQRRLRIKINDGDQALDTGAYKSRNQFRYASSFRSIRA